MHRPRIGIPLTLDERGRWRTDREYHYIDRTYADAIDRAGGMPFHLPIQADPRGVLESLDGLLLPGGDDFPSDSSLPEGVRLDPVATRQLAFDEALYDAARVLDIPILGICYGMQLMARREGGRLDAHLPSQRPEAIEHRLPAEARHPIEAVPSSRLAEALGVTTCVVNSLHHQAVREVGPKHRAVAHGPDGVIEALEAVDSGFDVLEDESAKRPERHAKPWRIGVQWHPEKMADATSDRLFLAFVDACRASHAERESLHNRQRDRQREQQRPKQR